MNYHFTNFCVAVTSFTIAPELFGCSFSTIDQVLIGVAGIALYRILVPKK